MKEWVDIQRIKNDEERDKYKLNIDWVNFSNKWNPQDPVTILNPLEGDHV
jgi:hypothetical protein